MPETSELQAVVDAAEQAAAAGDYAAAERLLREAALLQEASLGPLHPDLANTLNNLGVVCEITDKPVDAEAFYRRAHAIATAVLQPDHPFVATSRKNLSDFCDARGKPVELPTPPPVVVAAEESRATDSVPLPHKPLEQAASRPPVVARSSRFAALLALGAGGLVFVIFIAFIATRPWFVSNRQAEISAESATHTVPARPAPAPEPPPVEPPRVEPIPPPKEKATSIGGTVGAEESGVRKPSASGPKSSPTVAEAQLCRELSTARGEWQCVRPSQPVDPGLLLFYTRVRFAGDTTIQHRWYRGDSLRKVANLQILANPTDGYRTYSRQMVDHQSAGDWRVELRTKDGTLLHEERFVVR
jgi:hypothetical protein